MKRKTKHLTPPTDQELVDQVAAAGLDKYWRDLTEDDQRRRDELLAEHGLDLIDYLRAVIRHKRAGAAEPGGPA